MALVKICGASRSVSRREVAAGATSMAMRHGVIMRRVTERAILFGEAVEPPDLDDTIIHRATLRAMLDGTYWDRVGL